MCCPRPVAIATSSPIQAATVNMAQQPIISMEDDEISDQEVVSFGTLIMNSFVIFVTALEIFIFKKKCLYSEL